MTESRQSLAVSEPASETAGGNLLHGSKARRRRRLLRNLTFLLLGLLVLVLLAVVIHLAVVCGRSKAPEPAVRRPLLRWRRTGACPPTPDRCPAGPRPLLVVSLDGFRYDYLHFGVSPMLQDMLDCGVTAPYVRTSFPSKTFPNHYSIATGMYPESNGIVGNRMYDTALPGRRFKLGKQESLRPVWWRAEPVWETVRKMGGVSAVFFWPGSEVPGRLPTHYKRYDSKVPYEQRVTQIIDWLLLPEPKRPRYLSLYFEEPDKSGHSYGPNSEQVKAAVDRVDAQLASLYSQLMEHDLLGCVDVTVSSDHGMATVREDCESVILDDYVPGLSKNSTYVNGPVTRVRPDNQSSVNDLVEQLDCAHPALRVLHRDELPERWHYQQSSRIEPIIATVDQGYGMSVPSSDFCIRGMHGYDNDLVDMRSFFVAHGPSFKRNFTADPFENIQLYSLFQTLLGLPDIENNATKHSLDHLLVSPPSDRTPIGPAPVAASPPLEQTLTNPCCTELDNCRCQALEEWLAGTKNVSGTLPLPVSGRDVLLDATVDGSFAAEPSPKPSRSYRWLQYYLERDSNGSLTMPPLPAADSQCLFQSSGRPGPVQGCSVDSAYRSLVHTGGTDSYLGRLAASMYPMYPAYQERVLPELLRRLETYSRRYGLVAVLAGPVYRSEALDRFGQPIPSHFFYQLRMCGGRGCRPEEIVHKQWILPHKERFRPCEAAGKYVNFHEATLRDVERVSGLTLFAGQLASQPDSAHGSHARFITQLPELRPPLTWSN